MAIDSLNITFSCGEKKRVKKTVQQAKMDRTDKKVPSVNEKQQNFKKRG